MTYHFRNVGPPGTHRDRANPERGEEIDQRCEGKANGTEAETYAAIYCRSATTGGSIPGQLEACQAFAQQHGYTVPEAYVCVDDGLSGTVLKRPGLQRLRGLVRTRAIQAVIVQDLPRLSRTLAHLFQLAEECEDAEVGMHVVRSPSALRLDSLTFHVHNADVDGGERGASR